MTRRALLVLLLCASGCADRPSDLPDAGQRAPGARRVAPRSPYVLLVTLDTTRADRIGSYGHGFARTPALDAIAGEGVRVEHAVAVAPLTAPSHASMLTGLYPEAHGVRDNGSYRLKPEHRTVAEVFRERGYGTYAFVSAVVLDRRYGLDQGFDVYDDDLGGEADPAMFMIRERRGDRTVAAALDELGEHVRRHPRQPFFAWVHLFDVHQPVDAPLSERVRSPSPYDAEIAFVDQHVASLVAGLRDLGVYDHTALLVTADHGESLGEHGESTHGYFVYEATMHVPMLLRAPWILPRGYVHPGVASGTDVAPTLLALAGQPPLSGVQGRSIVASITRRSPTPGRLVFSEAKLTELGFGMAPLFAVRDDRYTYIRAPRAELYDRRADPREMVDRSARDTAEVTRLDAALDAWFLDSARWSRGEARTVIDAETLAALRALGYVSDVSIPEPEPSRPGAHARATTPRIDPKDGLRAHELLETTRHLAQAHEWARALDAAREALVLQPQNVSALNLLALAELRLGNARRAIAAYETSLRLVAEQPRVHTMLGQIAYREGRPERAIASFDRALVLMPGLVDAHLFRAAALRDTGRAAEADAALRALIETTNDRARIHRMIGELAFERGDFPAAIASFEAATTAAPDSAPSHHALALARHRAHDDARALAAVERAIALDADVWQYAYDRGCILASLGRTEDAFAAIDTAATLGLDRTALLDTDEDLASLRADPRFGPLRSRVASRSARVRGGDARPRDGGPRPARER